MKDKIELDNNYYLEVVDNIDNTATDINNLNIKEIKRKKRFVLKIDFSNFDKKDYKKILKRLLFIKSRIVKSKIEIGHIQNSKILIGYLVNYNQNDKNQNDFILAINTVFFNTRYDRYNYIYDTVCEYLDSYFYGENLCDFIDNKCGEKRDSLSTIGCCRHFKRKWLGPFSHLVICEHLKEDHTCDTKCISCKLFTCDYLVKKGIRFKIKDILLLNTFFNPIQKYFLKYMVYTTKEKILKRLMAF